MKSTCLLLLIVCLSVKPAEAKCGYSQYVFEGSILDESKNPIAGATVFLLLDNQESTLSEGYYTKYPDFFLSSTDGLFKVTGYFNSFRKISLFWRHICDKVPSKVEVVTTAPGFISKRVVFQFAALKVSTSELGQLAKLPPIVLRRSP